MSNYKHGDWFCKPANEEEAKEIVELALVSGAELYEAIIGQREYDYENDYEWDDCHGWGVLDGMTHTGNLSKHGSFVNATEYTITEVREKFPLLGEQQKEWNGDGFPPGGVECEAYIYADTIGQGKIKAKWVDGYAGCKAIAGNGGYGCIFIQQNGAIHFVESEIHFRPIRTERGRFVEAASAVFHGACINDYSGRYFADAMGAVYDAIKSGTLKVPEVE